MNSFQVARGYAPSIIVIPRQFVTQELLDAHIDREATRALERIMKAKTPDSINPERLPKGSQVFVYYKSSKQNEPNEWIPATVSNVGDNIVECRRKERGRPMTVGYNEIRLRPMGDSTNELMRHEMEEDMNENRRCDTEDVQHNGNETVTGTHEHTNEYIKSTECATPGTNNGLMKAGSLNARNITHERHDAVEITDIP